MNMNVNAPNGIDSSDLFAMLVRICDDWIAANELLKCDGDDLFRSFARCQRSVVGSVRDSLFECSSALAHL